MTPVRKIQQVTADFYHISIDELRGRSRLRRYAEPRQVAMFIARHRTKHTLPALGRLFGRDHSTVHHAIQKVGKTRRLRSAVVLIELGFQ